MGDFSMESTNTMHQEEGFTSMAPLAVRGPFSVFEVLREYSSKQRLRYKMNGFNLDMRYITPNIIALATPADRGIFETATRNHAHEVNRFFNQYHKGRVKYYNLVGELGKFVFDAYKLDATIEHDYAFLDHEVPGLARMQGFCNSVKGWLHLDPQNVVCVMCRSGRNRTAVMVCAYLLFRWPQEFQTGTDALAYFTWCRMRTGDAVDVASQRRYVGYFATRFAASPQTLRMSRVFIPVGPLRQSKIRLELYELQLSSDTKSGNENELRLIWTSKGKQLGKVEEGQTYVMFDLPRTLQLQGDIKVKFFGRKYANGPFVHLFSFWFNCGFIDHSPCVWDLTCFDDLSEQWKKLLPEDFHVQTLFVGKPRVKCTISKTKAARIYCWDCEDPYLSEEESLNIHRSRTVRNDQGEDVPVQSGPVHRFHPLVEEDCAICKHRHERYDKGLLPEDTMRKFQWMEETEKEMVSKANNPMEFLMMSQAETIRHKESIVTGSMEAYSEDQGIELLRHEKKVMIAEKKKEVLYYSGQLMQQELGDGGGRPPLFGLPTVYCTDTEQFLCAWCNKHALREKDRKGLVRYAMPLISSGDRIYSGCARQSC